MELHKIMIDGEIFKISLMCLLHSRKLENVTYSPCLANFPLESLPCQQIREVRSGGVKAVCPGAQSCPESPQLGSTNLVFAVATTCSLSLWQEKMQSLETYGSEAWGGGR